jgi:hypothetical protein
MASVDSRFAKKQSRFAIVFSLSLREVRCADREMIGKTGVMTGRQRSGSIHGIDAGGLAAGWRQISRGH